VQIRETKDLQRDTTLLRAIALGALLLYLAVLALQISPALHRHLHHDSEDRNHHCVVTVLRDGYLAVTSPDAVITGPATAIKFALVGLISVTSSFLEQLPDGRAPPLSA
jgi:hypothetical protein